MLAVLCCRRAVACGIFILSAPPLLAQLPCPPPQSGAAASSTPCAPYHSGARLKHYFNATVGPQAILFSAVSAGIGQARNAPSAWEQGMQGYGRRFGSSMAQRAVSGGIQIPVELLLGEDSRYVPSEKSGLWPRVGDAVLHSFVVRTRSGERGPPIGVLVGRFGGGLISRSWQPEGHDEINDGIVSGSYSFGYHIGANVFKEFWPDLRRLLHF